LGEGVLSCDAVRAVKFDEADLQGLLAPLDALRSRVSDAAPLHEPA
jgi:hypothetical protein